MQITVIDKFKGVNNTSALDALLPGELIATDGVVIANDGSLISSPGWDFSGHGYSQIIESGSGVFALKDGDLVDIDTQTTVMQGVGSYVPWCDTPIGMVFLVDGNLYVCASGSVSQLSVDKPGSLGDCVSVSGGLPPSEYRYALTRVTKNGVESAPVISGPIQVSTGGLRLENLPVLQDSPIAVYLANGEEFYRAGVTASQEFEYRGDGTDLVIPLMTLRDAPMPGGSIMRLWGPYLLSAVGKILYSSAPFRFHATDGISGFVSFDEDITALEVMNTGIYVGTNRGLYFLRGSSISSCRKMLSKIGRVIPGSSVKLSGCPLITPSGAQYETASLFLIDGYVVIGLEDGVCVESDKKYRVIADKVTSAIIEHRNQYYYSVAV